MCASGLIFRTVPFLWSGVFAHSVTGQVRAGLTGVVKSVVKYEVWDQAALPGVLVRSCCGVCVLCVSECFLRQS